MGTRQVKRSIEWLTESIHALNLAFTVLKEVFYFFTVNYN